MSVRVHHLSPAPRLASALAILLVALPIGIAPAQPRPLEDRLYAVPGSTIVIPVAFEGDASPFDPVRIWTADGRLVPTDVHRLIVERAPGPRTPIERWLPPTFIWSSAHNEMVRAGTTPPGFWALVAELPDQPVGRTLRIERQSVPIVWLATGDERRVGTPALAWQSPHAGTDQMPAAREIAALLMDQPDRRWRARLLTGSLGEPENASAEGLTDPILAAMARQARDRWASVVAELWRIDPALTHRVARRLGALVRFGPALSAPAWPTGRGELRQLMDLVLRPDLDDTRRAAAVRAWIDQQPRSRAWVVDDAGLDEGIRPRTGARVGMANLSGSRVLAAVRRRGSDQPLADPVVIEAWSAAILEVASPGTEPGAVELSVEIGSATHGLRVGLGATPARPPGVRIGPMAPEWTMRSWLAGRAQEQRAHPITLGALRRDPEIILADPRERASGPESGAQATSGWSLYLEQQAMSHPSPSPEHAEQIDRPDMVRIWLGPSDAPSHVLRVRDNGTVIEERSGEPMTTARVAREPGRWACQVPIPREAISATSAVRLGIERIDPRGRRWSWPRPVLPWQSGPGRAAIDLSRWSGLGTSE